MRGPWPDGHQPPGRSRRLCRPRPDRPGRRHASRHKGFHFNNTTSYVWWNTAYELDELGPDSLLETLERRRAAGGTAVPHRPLARTDPQADPPHRSVHRRPAQGAQLDAGRGLGTGPVTLLGDAIHAMTYFRALGGNTALYDSGLLVPQLVAATQRQAAASGRARLRGCHARARLRGRPLVACRHAAQHCWRPTRSRPQRPNNPPSGASSCPSSSSAPPAISAATSARKPCRAATTRYRRDPQHPLEPEPNLTACQGRSRQTRTMSPRSLPAMTR